MTSRTTPGAISASVWINTESAEGPERGESVKDVLSTLLWKCASIREQRITKGVQPLCANSSVSDQTLHLTQHLRDRGGQTSMNLWTVSSGPASVTTVRPCLNKIKHIEQNPNYCQAREVVQWAPAIKPENLSSILGEPCGGRKKRTPIDCSLTYTCMAWHTHILLRAYSNKHNLKKKKENGK